MEVLDAQSQARVLHNVLAESDGRTVVWVANRLFAGNEFDQIAVMKGGKVVQQGTFETLTKAGEYVARLLDVA